MEALFNTGRRINNGLLKLGHTVHTQHRDTVKNVKLDLWTRS